MALGELHEYSQKEIKMRRELKSGIRGRWTLLRKLNHNYEIN